MISVRAIFLSEITIENMEYIRYNQRKEVILNAKQKSVNTRNSIKK